MPTEFDIAEWIASGPNEAATGTEVDLRALVKGLDTDSAIATLTKVTGLQLEQFAGFLLGRSCGVPDTVETGPTGLSTQSMGKPRKNWDHGNLSWTTALSGIKGITPSQADEAVRGAMTMWSSACPYFRFFRVTDGSPVDITIDFDVKSDGPGRTLATAYGANSIQLDPAESWTSNFLLRTMVHELGHVLGLQHSTSDQSVMNPFVRAFAVVDEESRRLLNTVYGWAGPFQTVGGSSHGASMCTLGSALVRVNEGAKNDSGLWITYSSDGLTWSAQSNIPNRGSATTPAICGYDAQISATPTPDPQSVQPALMMVWRGIEGDAGVYWSTNTHLSNLAGFDAQKRLDGALSGAQPTVASHGANVYAAWRGPENDMALYWTHWDGHDWVTPQQIPWVGSSHGPALVSAPDGLHLFWKAMQDDRIFTSQLQTLFDTPNGWTDQSEVIEIVKVDVVKGTNKTAAVTDNLRSAASPAVCIRDGLIVLTMNNPDGSLRMSTRTPVDGAVTAISGPMAWDGNLTIPTFRTQGVCLGLGALGGRIAISGRGLADDRALYSIVVGDV